MPYKEVAVMPFRALGGFRRADGRARRGLARRRNALPGIGGIQTHAHHQEAGMTDINGRNALPGIGGIQTKRPR